MALSDPVRVFVGVAPSPTMAAEAANVAAQIQTSLRSSMSGVLNVARNTLSGLAGFGRSVAGSIGSAFANVGRGFGGEMAGAVGGFFALSGLQQAMQNTVGTGVRFLDTIEGVGIGLSGMLRQMEPKRFKTWDSAMAASQLIMAGLKKEALTTVATFQDLAQATQGIIGPMLGAGIPMERAAGTAAMLARATSALMPWARSGQIIQEGRALLTGNINQNAFIANALGITREQIMQARKSGTLLDFLTSKLGAFNEAAEHMANTLTGQLSNLRDAWEFAMADASAGVFDSLKAIVARVKAYVQGDEFKGMAKEFIAFFADVISGLSLLINPLMWVAEYMRTWSAWVGGFGGALLANLMQPDKSKFVSPLASASEEVRALTNQRAGLDALASIDNSLKGIVKVEAPGL